MILALLKTSLRQISSLTKANMIVRMFGTKNPKKVIKITSKNMDWFANKFMSSKKKERERWYYDKPNPMSNNSKYKENSSSKRRSFKKKSLPTKIDKSEIKFTTTKNTERIIPGKLIKKETIRNMTDSQQAKDEVFMESNPNKNPDFSDNNYDKPYIVQQSKTLKDPPPINRNKAEMKSNTKNRKLTQANTKLKRTKSNIEKKAQINNEKAKSERKDDNKIKKAEVEGIKKELKKQSTNNSFEMYIRLPKDLLSAIESKEFTKNSSPEIISKTLHTIAYSVRNHPFIKSNSEIINALCILCSTENMKKLNTESMTILFSLLITNRVQNQEVWKSITDELLKRVQNMKLDQISSIMFSLRNLSKISLTIININEIFKAIESEIIIKLNTEKFDQDAISKIIKAYSQTNNGTVDFYKSLEESIIMNITKYNGENLANILLDLSETRNYDGKLLNDFKELVIEYINKNKFHPSELCSVVKAFNTKQLINASILKTIENCFLSQSKSFSLADISTIYNIFEENKKLYNPIKIMNCINKCINEQYKTLNLKIAAIFLAHWNDPDCSLDQITKNNIKNQLIKLIQNKKQINKTELKGIYEVIKDEKGNSNEIKETIFKVIITPQAIAETLKNLPEFISTKQKSSQAIVFILVIIEQINSNRNRI